MRYQCKVNINEKLQRVSDLFQDQNVMPKWDTGIDWIEMISGEPFKPGSKAKLHYKFGDNKMIMNETIEENNMPTSITIIYEVDNAWNRCINTFTEEDNQVIWTMDSEFKFKEEINVPLETFIKQTTMGMEAFKNYVESIK